MPIINYQQLNWVDQQDRLLGPIDKFIAHQYPLYLHRAISVWLTNSEGQILLQKRSSKKIVKAHEWGNAVCGNVAYGESYQECAQRRLKQELGVGNWGESTTGDEIKLRPIYKFQYQAYGNEKYAEAEIDQVFIGQYNGQFQLNLEEVAEVSWVNKVDFFTALKRIKFSLAKATIEMDKKRLSHQANSVIINLKSKKSLKLVPWTILMGKDLRLQAALS